MGPVPAAGDLVLLAVGVLVAVVGANPVAELAGIATATLAAGRLFSDDRRWYHRPWRTYAATATVDLPLAEAWELLCRPEAAVLLGADVAAGGRDPASPVGRGERVLVHRQDGSVTVLTVVKDRHQVARTWRHTPGLAVARGDIEVRLGIHLVPAGDVVAVAFRLSLRGPRGSALRRHWDEAQSAVEVWARHGERAARDGLPTHEAWPLAAAGETSRDKARLSLCHSAVLPFPPPQVWDLVYPAEKISLLEVGTRGWRDPASPTGVGEVQVFENPAGVESRLVIVAHDPGRHSSFMSSTRHGCDLVPHPLGTLYRQEMTVVVWRALPHRDAEDVFGRVVAATLAALGVDESPVAVALPVLPVLTSGAAVSLGRRWCR